MYNEQFKNAAYNHASKFMQSLGDTQNVLTNAAIECWVCKYV